LLEALSVAVGESIVPLSVHPRLMHLFAQHTENAGWRNLPIEATSVRRAGANEWLVRVGDHTEVLDSATIWEKLAVALNPDEEGEQ